MACEIPGMMRQLFCKVTIDTVLYDTPEAEQLKAMPPLTVRNDGGRQLYGILQGTMVLPLDRNHPAFAIPPVLRFDVQHTPLGPESFSAKSCAFPTNIDEQTGSCYHRR